MRRNIFFIYGYPTDSFVIDDNEHRGLTFHFNAKMSLNQVHQVSNGARCGFLRIVTISRSWFVQSYKLFILNPRTFDPTLCNETAITTGEQVPVSNGSK